MFEARRRRPTRSLALVAIGFMLAIALTQGLPGPGFGLFFPFISWQAIVVVGAIAFLARAAGVGPKWGLRANGPSKQTKPGPPRRSHGQPPAPQWNRGDLEWQESLRRARAEVDQADRPGPWTGR